MLSCSLPIFLYPGCFNYIEHAIWHSLSSAQAIRASLKWPKSPRLLALHPKHSPHCQFKALFTKKKKKRRGLGLVSTRGRFAPSLTRPKLSHIDSDPANLRSDPTPILVNSTSRSDPIALVRPVKIFLCSFSPFQV